MAPKKPNEEYLTLACDGSIAVDESLGSLLRGVLLANEILGNIKLIIAGDISNKHAIEWSSQQLGIKNIIQIIPSKNNTWTKSCDVYVLLNTVNQSAPLSLIQAMAFAKPVIATNTLSNHEFIQQNNNGVLIKEINADMLSQAIINLSRKPEWMAELGKNNYNFAKEKFSDEVLQEKLSNILQ
jgi:glycosyltransferase involved in cell wall biosynthesis